MHGHRVRRRNARFQFAHTGTHLRAERQVLAQDGFNFRKIALVLPIAVQLRGTGYAGIQQASQEIDKKLAELEQEAMGTVRGTVVQVTSDQNLPDATRTKLTDLFTTYTDMKDYIDKPRGTPASFAAKTAELTDRYRKLVESLKLMTGVDVGQE